MAGVARLIKDPFEGKAEFAIVVADPYHGQGLGNTLTDYILEIAKKSGKIDKVKLGLLIKKNAVTFTGGSGAVAIILTAEDYPTRAKRRHHRHSQARGTDFRFGYQADAGAREQGEGLCFSGSGNSLV